MRWTSAFTFLSIVALLAAVSSQLLGWTEVRGWFLLAWAVLLLPVAIGLLSHPMRDAAWGLFIGFLGVVAVLLVIVLQALAVANVLSGPWIAYPLAVVGAWILVASGFGFGAAPFSAMVDVLGLLTAVGLLAIAAATLAGAADLARAAGAAGAVAYCLWAAGLGWVFWGLQRQSPAFNGVVVERRL